MARITFLVSPTTPDGRPFPSSILFDVEYQNDESEKETNGTEITQAIIAKRSIQNVSDKFETPFIEFHADYPGLPHSWSSLFGGSLFVPLPVGHYIGCQFRIRSTTDFAGYGVLTGYAENPDPIDEQGMEQFDGSEEFFIEVTASNDFCDSLSEVSIGGHGVLEVFAFLQDSGGIISDFSADLKYEIIFG